MLIPQFGSFGDDKKEKERQEQEVRDTSYDPSDLEGWEFKIMRSSLGKFRNQKYVDQLCQTESESG